MVSLDGRFPSETFQFLLNVDNPNGIDGTVRPIQDGEGTQGPFSVSTGVFRLNAGVQMDAGAGAAMDFANITVTNLRSWTKLAEVSPTSGSSFQVLGIPSTANAILIGCSDMGYDANSRIEVSVMDDSVVQSADYFCTSVFYDDSSISTLAVTNARLHMVRINNIDGDSVQSCIGLLVKNGTTGVWNWQCSGRNNNTVMPTQISYAHAAGTTPVIAGIMNGLEFDLFTGAFEEGTVTIYFQEE